MDEEELELEQDAGRSLLNAPATPSQDMSGNARQQRQFEKFFCENRGDNNRAWKARRRAVLKEKRQRENRARRPKMW